MTTDILIILDRSGSMQDARDDHEGGLRSFIRDQKQGDGEARLTLIQFDSVNPCEVCIEPIDIRLVDENIVKLIPRGGTPLLDAVGKGVAYLRERKPEAVIVMIITDGHENNSTEWTKAKVQALVKELEGEGWTFLFLGADIDAFAEASQMGVQAAAALNFNTHIPNSVQDTYNVTSSKMVNYRGLRQKGLNHTASAGAALQWTEAERQATATGTASATTVPSLDQVWSTLETEEEAKNDQGQS